MNGPSISTQPVLRRSLQVAACVLLALVFAVAIQQSLRVRSNLIADERSNLVRLSVGFAGAVEQSAAIADLMLREQIARIAGGMEAVPARSLAGIEPLLDLSVIGANGEIVADTRPPADRSLPPEAVALLAQLRAGDDGSVLLSTPFRLPDGRRTVLLGRRLPAPDGRFRGAGIAWLNLAAFELGFRPADVSAGGFVRLERSDGVPLVRYPSTPTDGARVAAPDSDGAVARAQVRGYPLAVVVGAGSQAALEVWRQQMVMLVLAAGATAVVLGGVLLALGQKTADADRLGRAYTHTRHAADEAAIALQDEVAARERAEAVVWTTHRRQVMGNLTGSVAHDFNNLLTVVLGNLDLLEMDRTLAVKVVERLGAMRAAAEKGELLTGQLLAFARRQLLRPSRISASGIVSAMADLLRSAVGSKIRVEIDAPEGLPAVMIDPHQLELAIMNLALNARDAMPDGGTLRVSVSVARRQGEFVELRVEDTGEGMAPDVLARAAEPFFTTKNQQGSAGLGLAQVRQAAQAAGGELLLRSAPGQGTLASIVLPASRAARGEEREPVREAPSGGLRVLLVDDDAAVRSTTALILSDFGFAVLEAAGSSAALDVLAANEPVDVLVTDMGMPGMPGPELARRATMLRPGLPVVFLSGDAGWPAEPGDGQPAQRMVRKPFRPAELAIEIASVLRPKV